MTAAPDDGTATGPTVLRILLGGQLRKLREARGIGREDAGYAIRASGSKISRMELGRVGFKERDVADLLTLYGVADDSERDALLALARQANNPGWWHRYGDVLPSWFQSYLGLEAAASLIRSYEVQFVPGLLQTPDYARSVILLGHGNAPADEIERRVTLRMSRQKLLTRPGAPQLWVVLDEAVLRRPIGGPEVMRAQLLALIEATKLPNVTLQVISFQAGVTPPPGARSPCCAFRTRTCPTCSTWNSSPARSTSTSGTTSTITPPRSSGSASKPTHRVVRSKSSPTCCSTSTRSATDPPPQTSFRQRSSSAAGEFDNGGTGRERISETDAMRVSRLDDAVALVTGGSSGIGAATARRLATAGTRLFLAGRNAERLAAVAAPLGGTAIPCDLAEPGGAARLAARVLAIAGRVDVLIHGAGQGWAGPLTGMDDIDITRLVAANLAAPMQLTRAVLPGMLARGRGHLGFIGSIAGRLGVREEAVYSATKAGLNVFADSLRQETAGCRIVVTELVPAVVETDFFSRRGRPYQRRSPQPVAADRAAAALLAAMLRGRDEAYLPRWLYLPVAVRATLPGTYRRLAGRFG